MTPPRLRRLSGLLIAVAAAVALTATVGESMAQVPPLLGSTTTTAPESTTTTAAGQPDGGDLSSGTDQAPAGAQDAGGDGAAPPSGGIAVPPEAQRIIDSVRRSGSNRTDGLVAQVETLESLGVSREEAYRIGLGRFPIAGRAHYTHDWLYPRYGPGFRFHLGTDVFAAYGTPVRSPVDGVAHASTSELGGLSVKVYMPDGTYFYMAHLSGLVDGFAEGMPVATGDIVGYVGDSGNARGGSPHVHFSIYPYGGPPVDPKPILDSFIAEAEARLPDVIAALTAASPGPAAPTAAAPLSISEERRMLRPTLATEVLHQLHTGRAWPVELLYTVAANSVSGGRGLVQLSLDDMAASIDWPSG